MLELAVFNSHPIQHFAPWWQEVARNRSIRIKVFYYSRANMKPYNDKEFGTRVCYDVDLLGGYDYSFLPRAWPFRNDTSVNPCLLNKGIRRAVRERPWDGVLVFGYNMLNNWKVLYECRKAGIPLLYFSDSSSRVGFNRSRFKLTVRNYLIRKYLARIDAFLSPNNSNGDYLKKLGAPSTKIWRCPYPVDVPRFLHSIANHDLDARTQLRQRYQLTMEDFVVVFSGKLSDRKRPFDLVDAIRTIGDPTIKALFVGTGALEREVRERGGEYVRMAGFVNQEEMPRILALGDLSVLPSSYDLHPLAVVESLVLGIPVLATDIIGLHGPEDLLRHGENGYVYRCGDVQELARLIVKLKSDNRLRRCMSQRAAELGRTQSPQVATEVLTRCLQTLHQGDHKEVRAIPE